ncbi:Kinesin [Spironucleus salmonicida]|uniref:Kinesin n=1 Tax=Spironucleus salmonicida TaxID=348837 RepID=V6LDF9_9EUKA|nr:Kinesin [Spironucleus salmonicida]|eukprot:EST41696.1 Kinesin [Spironucleus salmonicida]
MSVSAFVRVKPLLNQNSSAITIQKNTLSLDLNDRNPQSFAFDGIIPQASGQQFTYDEVQRAQTNSFLAGINTCTFCYGQTSSGKSFTCGFSPNNNDGIVQKTFCHIFEQKSVKVIVSLYQIYNEQIFDLLSPDNKLQLKEVSKNNFKIVNLQEFSISSVQEANNIVLSAIKNQYRSSTVLNENSSRSHTILQIFLNNKILQIIDLAGSERVKKTQVEGQKLNELIKINQSLTCLGNVIQSLQQENNHIPFRDSVLTKILARSLSQNQCNITILGTICSDIQQSGESLNTLIFVNKCKNIKLSTPKLQNKDIEQLSQFQKQFNIDLGTDNKAIGNFAKLLNLVVKDLQNQNQDKQQVQKLKYEASTQIYQQELESLQYQIIQLQQIKQQQYQHQHQPSKLNSSLTQIYQILQSTISQVDYICNIISKHTQNREIIKNQNIDDILLLNHDRIQQIQNNIDFKDHICAGKCIKCQKVSRFIKRFINVVSNDGLQEYFFKGIIISQHKEVENQKGVYKGKITIPDASFFKDEASLVSYIGSINNEFQQKLQFVSQVVQQGHQYKNQNQDLRSIALQTVLEHSIDILNVSRLLDSQNQVINLQKEQLIQQNKVDITRNTEHIVDVQDAHQSAIELSSNDDEFDQLAEVQRQVRFI